MKLSELKAIIMECIDELNESGPADRFRKKHGKFQDTGEDPLTKKVGSVGRYRGRYNGNRLRKRTLPPPHPIIKTSHTPTSKELNRHGHPYGFNNTRPIKSVGRFQMYMGSPNGKISGERFKGGDFEDYTYGEEKIKARNKK